MRILFCGQSGIPSNRNATLNRYTSIAKAMSSENEIIFINRIPLLSKNDSEIEFEFDVVDVTGVKFRPHNFIKRNILKIFIPFFEFTCIRKLNKKKKIDWVNVYTQYFGLCLWYSFLSRVFKFRTILHYVEKRSTFKNRGFLMSINDYLFDRFGPRLVDRIIPISNLLNSDVKKINSDLITLVIPPICDFDYFKTIQKPLTTTEKYFLFCGSTAYSDVIDFILDSFILVKHPKAKLYLVLNGQISVSQKNKIENSNGLIKLFSKLEYTELISLYKGSYVLLVPLRNTIQDIARFPQKICEYLAAEKTFISTNVGEVKIYFKNKINALLADEFDTVQFSEQLQWAMDNQDEINKIESNAYKIGQTHFDIKSYNTKLKQLLK